MPRSPRASAEDKWFKALLLGRLELWWAFALALIVGCKACRNLLRRCADMQLPARDIFEDNDELSVAGTLRAYLGGRAFKQWRAALGADYPLLVFPERDEVNRLQWVAQALARPRVSGVRYLARQLSITRDEAAKMLRAERQAAAHEADVRLPKL